MLHIFVTIITHKVKLKKEDTAVEVDIVDKGAGVTRSIDYNDMCYQV